MAKQWPGDKIQKIASLGLAVVFGLVVFHAPLSVFFGRYADPLLVKSWKELVLLLAVPLIFYIVWCSGQLARFSRDAVLRLIVAYALLHVLLLLLFATSSSQKLAGLAIDLRYLLFFVLVFCLASLQPSLRGLFLRVSAWAAGLSVGFAALQALILPPDILKIIGYSKQTIEPYLTVDKNSDFVRINGTLRGPNPLGAYAMVVLSLVAALWVRFRAAALRHRTILLLGAGASLAALWASYSRSALLGLGVSLAIIFLVRFGRTLRPLHWLVAAAVLALLAAGLFAARESAFVQNVVHHNNPAESENFNSNEGHAASLETGLVKFVQQPLGGGVGSTGSASLLGGQPLIIENQYFFVAHETGWLGLGLFVAIVGLVLKRLYNDRRDWLSLGVFASGVGLAVIGLIQPVFVDDTVSLVWWGLAAIALATTAPKREKHAKKPY